MKRVIGLLAVVLWIGVIGSGAALAEPQARGFGFGGSMAMAFFPDMTGINVFLSENGLPPMGGMLVGAGGGGRGGVIGGPVFGGVGWGVLAATESADRSAELVFGGGGFDVGRAIGGDENSVLTIGAVLGGGANVLTLSGSAYPTGMICPGGVVPEPIEREIGCAVGFIQPYVSLSAQLLPWMGFELRIGYVHPLFGIEFGSLVGIPAPSLRLAGPTVSLGVLFGGIGPATGSDWGAADVDGQVVSSSSGSFVVAPGARLSIENGAGDVVISAHPVAATEGTSDLVVEWQAVRTGRASRIDELQVVADVTDTAAALTTVGTGRVDYVLRIPSGIDLHVKNGAGNVTLVGHEAQTIILENGAGDVQVQEVSALALIVAGGVGTIQLPDVSARQLVVDLGVGEIALGLPVDASAAITARASIGEVAVQPFPGMVGGTRGFLGGSGDVTLGDGEDTVELTVGIGRIDVRALEP